MFLSLFTIYPPKIFYCLWPTNPKYFRGTFWTLSNIYDETLFQKSLTAFGRQQFLQKFPSEMFETGLNTPQEMGAFLELFLQKNREQSFRFLMTHSLQFSILKNMLYLTLSWRPLSYRNRSTDFLRKS